MTKQTTSNTPPRPRKLVGSDYYFASGIIRSQTQFFRLKREGRISLFKNGARLAQWQDEADRQLAALIGAENYKNEAA